jgi:lysosomal acid lipase/cholesteryl ester hydrolase
MSTGNVVPKKRIVHRKSISDQLEHINSPLFSLVEPQNATTVNETIRVVGDGIQLERNAHIYDVEALEEESKTNINQSKNESFLKKVENFTSILLIILEQLITSITFLLPDSLISMFTSLSRLIFSAFKSKNDIYNAFISNTETSYSQDALLQKVEKLRNFQSFHQICELNGFKAESHMVHTDDGFNLTLHRLNPEINTFKSNGKAVYLQHGLLMSSDIWCVMLNKNDNLPFKLCELGYDVFLGNNRGNKYSNKHVEFDSSQSEFWNFSLDEFAMYDIPASINYILNLKKINHLTYIGFSQGCSQILSSVSINNDLNDKIDKLILIAPATTPKRLSNWLINSIVHFDPELIYLLFGRKILMKSVMFWRRITYPPMFVKLIDIPNDILFDWKSKNIDIMQKLVSYYHLYSTTSVKCAVHWFQIIKSKRFQMYQDEDYFQPFEYPTDKTINPSKMLIIYGMSDSLVDIDVLVDQLPEFKNLNFKQIKNGKVVGKKTIINNVEIESNDVEPVENYKEKKDDESSELTIFGINGYEHLDLLWGKYINENVISNIVNFME